MKDRAALYVVKDAEESGRYVKALLPRRWAAIHIIHSCSIGSNQGALW